MPGRGTPPRHYPKPEIPMPQKGENMRWRTKNDSRNPTPSPSAYSGAKAQGPRMPSLPQISVGAKDATLIRGTKNLANSVGGALDLLTGKRRK